MSLIIIFLIWTATFMLALLLLQIFRKEKPLEKMEALLDAPIQETTQRYRIGNISLAMLIASLAVFLIILLAYLGL